MLEVSPRPALGGGLRALKSAAAGWGWGRDCGGARGPIPCAARMVQRRRGGRVSVETMVARYKGEGSAN